MLNVRDKIQIWSRMTYGEYVKRHYQGKIKYDTISVFDKLQITDKIMDGFSCEKLPKDEEGRIGLKTTYSEIFHNEIKNADFSPASYLVSILSECQKQKIDSNKYMGILARGLRSFTSLLREPDLALQLNELLNKNQELEIVLNPKQDSSDHTDILILKGDKSIRLWLYQFSLRGLPHDVERLTEKRGKLPKGIHILCPLHTEVAIDYICHKSKLLRLSERIASKEKEISECSPRAIKKRENLSNMLTKNKDQFQTENSVVNKLKQMCNRELDEVYGWFLYSDENAKRIAQTIISALNDSNKLTSYREVNEMLTSAEKFIGSNNIFIKEE